MSLLLIVSLRVECGRVSSNRPTVEEFLSSHSPEIEKNFLARVRLPNRTFKTTQPHRMDDLNRFSLPLIAALPQRPLRIMDVAASSGVSSAEWLDFLELNKISASVLATDKLLEADAVRVVPGLTVLIDRDRKPLHIDIGSLGL